LSGIVRFTVPGEPVPMERARRGRHGNWYTPAKSVEYRERIQTAWMQAGRPSFDAQPVTVCAYVYVGRPASHFTSKGEIRARHEHAIPPGDTDNYAKAIADALNALAYRDDTQITCWAAIAKHWALSADARTEIQLWSNR
jgi:Holliday junction resolvase RusA-like endonuclease